MAVWWSLNWRLTTLMSTVGCSFFQAGTAARTISSTAGKAATVSTCCACAGTDGQGEQAQARPMPGAACHP